MAFPLGSTQPRRPGVSTNIGDFCINRPASSRENSLPDIDFLKQIAIVDVAQELGVEVTGPRTARCWRPERHQHGDRTPSVGFCRKRNKARCFVCDPRALSTIDLVQQVLGSSVIEAVQWLDDRFPGAPRIVKGKHIVKRRAQEEIGTRIGVDSPWTDLRRSAFLGATMTPAEQCVLSALVELANPTTGEARLSYRTIARISGVRSDTSIARALRRLEQMSLLEINRGQDSGRQANRYKLTAENISFQELVRAVTERMRRDIASEKELRKLRLQPKATGIYVSNNWSSGQSHRSNKWRTNAKLSDPAQKSHPSPRGKGREFAVGGMSAPQISPLKLEPTQRQSQK